MVGVGEDEVRLAAPRSAALPRDQPRDVMEGDDLVGRLVPQPVEQAEFRIAFRVDRRPLRDHPGHELVDNTAWLLFQRGVQCERHHFGTESARTRADSAG
jgi:hypothetical protein